MNDSQAENDFGAGTPHSTKLSLLKAGSGLLEAAPRPAFHGRVPVPMIPLMLKKIGRLQPSQRMGDRYFSPGIPRCALTHSSAGFCRN